MENQNDKPLTEGEKIIEQFFKDRLIKYKSHFKLTNLKGDRSNYREADFYLPKLKLYVEFLGQWNSGDLHRERYSEKRRVYKLNNIPCIYLYPENLGFLEQAFNMRAEEELRSKNMKLELLKFKHYQIGDKLDTNFTGFLIVGVFLFMWTTRNMNGWTADVRQYVVYALLIVLGVFLINFVEQLLIYLKILFKRIKL